MDVVVRADHLTKRYGKARGIEDVSFEVRAGEVFGFLGPNGAGKTTTLRLLLDLLRPTSGTARVLGLDSREGSLEVRRRVGFLPSDPGFAPRMTARQHLTHLAALREMTDTSPAEALAHRFGLDLDRPVKSLSRGNQRKVGLVQAFMHDPDLRILDEPTSGLDPLMQQEFQKLVRERRAAGRTVFLSSHMLPEVEHLCDRVGIIREGRILAVEDMATVKSRAVRRLKATYRDGRRVERTTRGDVGPLVRELATEDIVDLTIAEPTLEDVFLGFYGEAAS